MATDSHRSTRSPEERRRRLAELNRRRAEMLGEVEDGASSVHDTDSEVVLSITVRAPRSLAPAMHAALTGADNDLLLAGETAMRSRLAEETEVWGAAAGLELDLSEADRYRVEVEAGVEERSAALYGPAVTR